MKKRWEIKSLENLENEKILALGRGIVISRKDIFSIPGNYPVYSSAQLNNGVFGVYGKYMFDEELITWSVDGGGSLFYRPKHKFSITNVGGYCRILRTDILDYRYLYFVLVYLHSTIKFDWVKKAHPSVLRKEYKTIPIPTLSEQKEIVSILVKAFADIAKAKENAEQNLKNAKELFDSYLQSVFSNKGDGWEEKTLSEVCAKITDGTHQTPTYYSEGIIFLSSRNVTSGKVEWNNIKYIDEKQHLEMHKRVAPRIGDILLAKNGTTGVAAMVDRDVVFDIYVSLALIRVLDTVLPSFMLYFINSPVAKKQFNKRLKGMGVPNLHLEEIREVIISYPKSLKEQNRVVKKLDSLSTETKRLENIYQNKIDDLEELKKKKKKKAFNGEL